MATTVSTSTQINTRQFLREHAKYKRLISLGQSFTIVEGNEPVYNIIPVQKKKKYTKQDLMNWRFSGPKDLSKNIDKYIYGY